MAMASLCDSWKVSVVQVRSFTSLGTSWVLVGSWGSSMLSVLVSDACCSMGRAVLDACLLNCLDRCWCLASNCDMVDKKSSLMSPA
jgi:hypothetical protein